MEDKEKQLSDEINSLLSNDPSDIALKISELEKVNTKKILNEYGKFVKQFEDFFDLLITLFDQVNYINKDAWPEQKTIQFITIAHNLQTLYCAFDLAVRGHHAEAIILIRTVYETFIKVVYLSCYAKAGYSVFYKKKDGTKEFNLTNFLSQDLKLNRDNIYMVMSVIAHSKGYLIMKEAQEIATEGQKGKIGLRIKYDKKNLEMAINYLYFLLWMFIKITIELFVQNKINKASKELLEKAKKVEKAIEKIFIGHPGGAWKTIDQDVSHIFKIIKLAEEGDDWEMAIKNNSI
ncbi:MAG: hypothetical protein PHT84_02840 [Candidatus Pacebacteria bacterium]|nr:hypothetical protein [Candidatus Paceibacterota bacterium]